MESLWKSEVFTADDFRVFRYIADPAPGVIDNVPECTAFYTNTNLLSEQHQDNWLPEVRKRNLNDWNEWLKKASPALKKEENFALLLPPIPPRQRPSRFGNLTNPAVLKKLPISQQSFQSIVKKLSIHHALAVIVDRGVPTISRIQSEINRKNCYVYTLRVEHTLKDQTAMTITHFPKVKPNPITPNGSPASKETPVAVDSETYAVILGYTDADTANLKRCLQSCKESIFNPFTLIKAFLRIERGHRFKEVDEKIVNFQNILQNYGRLPLGADADQTQHVVGGNVEDPKNLIGLYLDMYTLKNRLVAWKTKIGSLKNFATDFSSFTAGQTDIDPGIYLQSMVDEYDVKINKCDMVLQGASLAFQMETAHLARLDSARSLDIAKLARLDSQNAIRDGKQMKAIALLTMVFLPGTFIATLLAVPVFDSIKDTTLFEPWAWYPILFLPLTAVVLLGYFLWTYFGQPKDRQEVDTISSKWVEAIG